MPYFYFGSWRTTFAWHCEDLDLPSINYLHLGKPKFWYAVSPKTKHLLEEAAQRYFPTQFSMCKENLRHKTTLINPYLLKKLSPEIEIVKIKQERGEFVITFPGTYHAGFNWGFNIAEAVNFGTNGWIQSFTSTNVCQCDSDTVTINADEFYSNLIKSNPLNLQNSSVKKLKA